MSLTAEEIAICNQAYDRFGSDGFTYANQATDLKGQKADRHYVQTRNSLLRSFTWPFASDRAVLARDTSSPPFQWDYRYKLPKDYLRMIGHYETNPDIRPFEIEGDYLLTNDDVVWIKYIKKVTDTTKFDSLFTEVLILRLALKFRPAIAGTKTGSLYQTLTEELRDVESRARTICRQETNVSGRSSWNLARHGTSSAGSVTIESDESY